MGSQWRPAIPRRPFIPPSCSWWRRTDGFRGRRRYPSERQTFRTPPTINSVSLVEDRSDRANDHFRVRYTPDPDQVQWINDDTYIYPTSDDSVRSVSEIRQPAAASGPFAGEFVDGSLTPPRPARQNDAFKRSAYPGNSIRFQVQTQNRVGYSPLSAVSTWNLQGGSTEEESDAIMSVRIPPSALHGFSVRKGKVYIMGSTGIQSAPIPENPTDAPTFTSVSIGSASIVADDPEDGRGGMGKQGHSIRVEGIGIRDGLRIPHHDAGG